MKKLIYPALIGSFVFALASCAGESAEEKKAKEEAAEKPKNIFQALGKMAGAAAGSAKGAEEVMKARKAKGDTLAMPYEQLEKYLPESIDGYERGEPTGATVNMMGASYSNAEVSFKKKGDTGKRIKVEIIDYNQAYGMYSSLTMVWAMGMSVDSPTEKSGGVKLDNGIGGWETYHKKSKDAEVTLGVGYRFWVHVRADEQENTEGVKAIAKSIDLSTLASM